MRHCNTNWGIFYWGKRPNKIFISPFVSFNKHRILLLRYKNEQKNCSDSSSRLKCEKIEKIENSSFGQKPKKTFPANPDHVFIFFFKSILKFKICHLKFLQYPYAPSQSAAGHLYLSICLFYRNNLIIFLFHYDKFLIFP